MLKPTYGHIPKLTKSVDNLIEQLELYLSYEHDRLDYDLHTSGFDELDVEEAIRESEAHVKEVRDFINKLKSMSSSY